jgi:hypothetical protein
MLDEVVANPTRSQGPFVVVILWYSVILSICAMAAEFGLLESLHAWVVPGLATPQRLARVQGGISPQGPWVEVVKTQTPEGLQLQVSLQALNAPPELSQLRQQNLTMEKSFDAHAFFQGRWVNLLLVDTNQDGYQELLVPYMDQGLKTGVKIYQYDPFIEQFILRDWESFN